LLTLKFCRMAMGETVVVKGSLPPLILSAATIKSVSGATRL